MIGSLVWACTGTQSVVPGARGVSVRGEEEQKGVSVWYSQQETVYDSICDCFVRAGARLLSLFRERTD